MKEKYFAILLFLLATIALYGCSGGDKNCEVSRQERFAATIIDSSRELTSEDIFDGLTSLEFGASELVEWKIVDGDSLILTASLQSDAWDYASAKVGESFITPASPDDAIWVTIPQELNKKLLAEGAIADSVALNVRLLEIIGLRPDGNESTVNLLWVNKNNLLRPSFDPNPQTTHGAIEYPSTIAQEWYKEWFEGNIEYCYTSPEEGLYYPFTRLGYTYDWGEGQSKFGLSEFITTPQSTIIIEERIGCWSYYKAIL